ncbi:hypothetical protein EII29_03010 [Leptotrichia sp. OH3620_COT-345]|uniref:hypothetical protein n=1 Tax=Leptotrichia sp. OH3620_COT-345 TaxID=2491048 RepID=UPI000F64EF6A|nr:hypothetical protein [Leptotrichia sp. OH3620_COT-345]RRD40462.1 hypothetical protein EII29_03010 [Leptotrichia sp. OH3620_COT-345]
MNKKLFLYYILNMGPLLDFVNIEILRTESEKSFNNKQYLHMSLLITEIIDGDGKEEKNK